MIIVLHQEGSRKDLKRAQQGPKKRVNAKWGTICLVERQYRKIEHITLEDIRLTFILIQLDSVHHQNKLRTNQTYTQSSEDRANILDGWMDG